MYLVYLKLLVLFPAVLMVTPTHNPVFIMVFLNICVCVCVNLKWSASLACISNTMDMTFSIIPLYTFLYMLNIMLFKLYPI